MKVILPLILVVFLGLTAVFLSTQQVQQESNDIRSQAAGEAINLSEDGSGCELRGWSYGFGAGESSYCNYSCKPHIGPEFGPYGATEHCPNNEAVLNAEPPPTYTDPTYTWVCGSAAAAKAFCGSDQGTNNSKPECAITGVPSTELSGKKVNFSIKFSGVPPIVATSGYPQTDGARCTQVVGDFGGNLKDNNPRSGYYNLRAAGGLCQLSMQAVDGAGNQISCDASTGVQCNPVQLQTKIAYTTQTGLSKGGICDPNNSCLTKSSGTHEKSSSLMQVSNNCGGKPVTAICVKAENSTLPFSTKNIYLTYGPANNVNQQSNFVTKSANESTWYALPVSKFGKEKQQIASAWNGASINYTSYCHAVDSQASYFKKQ